MRKSGESPGECRDQDRGGEEEEFTGSVVEILGQQDYQLQQDEETLAPRAEGQRLRVVVRHVHLGESCGL